MISGDNTGNPYSIVREEQWSEDFNDVHIINTKGFDVKGRVVSISPIRYRNGIQIGHFSESVEADGYWHGGFYDKKSGQGGQTYHPFIDG